MSAGKKKMMNGMLAVLTVLTVFAPIASTGLFGHEGHLHRVMSTVAVIDSAHVEIETKSGKKESFLLTKETRYLRGKRPGAATDVTVGERAVVSVIEKDGKKVVTEVLLGDATASQAASDKR